MEAFEPAVLEPPPTISPDKILQKRSYFPTGIAVERTNLQKYIHFHGKRSDSAKNEKINAHLHEFNETSDISAKDCINAGFWEQAMVLSRINSNKVVCAVISALKFL
ncbi:hypothetical protein [Paenibacillus radicis (ex Xue et al. 2023)]|uniref:Uncharacterized protein n=1 Tax=Paenibacillus radicis (ex Xue et al. 2023) TaxID=2972489 RepID=A0ABT1YA74_9BACL|nr:hypothetical protein [Paenibacillus radicis (ex Xue et al. 2023)]MCR8630111.1 hypothetical protein [Paenibacillus radicis (ex Xue et al. 2023)]